MGVFYTFRPKFSRISTCDGACERVLRVSPKFSRILFHRIVSCVHQGLFGKLGRNFSWFYLAVCIFPHLARALFLLVRFNFFSSNALFMVCNYSTIFGVEIALVSKGSVSPGSFSSLFFFIESRQIHLV